MSNFTELRFESTPGVTNAKIWSLDDFGFQATPEPASMVMLGIGGVALIRKKRKI